MEEDEELMLAIQLSLAEAEKDNKPMEQPMVEVVEKKENVCLFCNQEFPAIALVQHQRWCEAKQENQRNDEAMAKKMQEEMDRDYQLAKELEREENDPQIKKAKEKSSTAERYKKDDEEYAGSFSEFCTSMLNFKFKKVLDLSAFELADTHVESLLLLFQNLVYLEEIKLSFPYISDQELALVVSCFPRTIKRLSLGAFMESSSNQTNAALQLLMNECTITHLEIVVEPFMKCFDFETFVTLKSLRLTSQFTGENLALLSSALVNSPGIEELALCSLVEAESVEKLNELIYGVANVVASVKKTVCSLVLGFFPGFRTKDQCLVALGKELSECRLLKKFYLFSQLKGEATKAIVEPLFVNNQDILEEIGMTTRNRALLCFDSPNLRFKNLQKLYCCGVREPRGSDLTNVFRCLNPETIKDLFIEMEELFMEMEARPYDEIEEDGKLFEKAALEMLSKMTNLEKLSLICTQQSNSKDVLPCLKNLKNLKHLGLNFTNIEEDIPKSITSLDYFADLDQDNSFYILALDLSRIRSIYLLMRMNRDEGELFMELGKRLANCESISVLASAKEHPKMAEEFFAALFQTNGAFNLRELNLADMVDAPILYQGLNWSCAVSFNVKIVARHFGVSFCQFFPQPFFKLLEMKGRSSKKTANDHSRYGSSSSESDSEDGSDGTHWPSLVASVLSIKKNDMYRATRKHRITGALRRLQNSGILLEFGKVLWRRLPERNLRRLIIQKAAKILNE